jgi:nucleotide-binding universal stress UspA family protein
MAGDEIREPTLSSGHTLEIVVGVDGSPAAAAAVRWAAEQARLTDLSLCMVHAWQLSALESAATTAGSGTNGLFQAAGANARAQATQWVREALGAQGNKRPWRLKIVEAAPGPALVAESRGARLLVIGVQEHTGLRRAGLGSVSHFCLSHAQVPVVAVSLTHASPDERTVSRDVFATPVPSLHQEASGLLDEECEGWELKYPHIAVKRAAFHGPAP